MTIQERSEQVLNQARELFTNAKSWAEFSNMLFSEEGIVAKTFPLMTDRKAFFDTPQHAKIDEMLLKLIKRFGVSQSAAPKKSGKFVVRLPKSLHASLEIEAEEEGVSLNQLATTKLAVPLRESADLDTAMLVEAFKRSYEGYASDRVVVDPELNAAFLGECRGLGLTQSDYELNHILLSIRKSGRAVLPPATKKPKITDYDNFLFASEIAARHLQRQDGLTLDRVLCDPSLRQRFDEIALRFGAEKSVLKLRMGALYLRKMHRLSPEDKPEGFYDLRPAGRIADLRLGEIPDMPGLYAFFSEKRPIFAAETAKLRHRIDLHLATANKLFLPKWLELGFDEGSLELRCYSQPKISTTERLNWLNQYINSERPLLNYQAAA
jgi:hypothetical protein